MVALTKLIPAAFGVGVVERGRRAAAPVVADGGGVRVALDANRGDEDVRRALCEVEAMSLAEPAAIDDVGILWFYSRKRRGRWSRERCYHRVARFESLDTVSLLL